MAVNFADQGNEEWWLHHFCNNLRQLYCSHAEQKPILWTSQRQQGVAFQSVCHPVCPRACPTDSSSHFWPKNSVCHQQKPLTRQVFVLEINHRDGQTSRPRFQWTFPQKTASLPTNDTVRQCPVYWWRLFYYVIQSEKLCHFPGCLVGQVGLVWINREDTGETPWKNTVTAAILTALWLKHRMKHISSRSSYLSSRKAENQLICILSTVRSQCQF